ncbi:MAG: hypothetical protein AMXMBFR58_17290 [Phycisphaerae bacterium]|nr:ECF-type sigma factor [Phycisphaerales bacterium]
MTDPRSNSSEHARDPAPGPAGADQSARITRLISQAQAGEGDASEELLPLVYDELRRLAASHLAREPSGLTLQPTALVHEVYLRLLGGSQVQWQGKGHFFAAAAQAMRRILVDRARARAALKRGGDRRRDDLAIDALSAPLQTPGGTTDRFDLLKLNEALERLHARDRRQADVVMLRYFAGLTIEQTAQALGLSTGTVKNEWTFAKAWLRRELENAGMDDAAP